MSLITRGLTGYNLVVRGYGETVFVRGGCYGSSLVVIDLRGTVATSDVTVLKSAQPVALSAAKATYTSAGSAVASRGVARSTQSVAVIDAPADSTATTVASSDTPSDIKRKVCG